MSLTRQLERLRQKEDAVWIDLRYVAAVGGTYAVYAEYTEEPRRLLTSGHHSARAAIRTATRNPYGNEIRP